MHTLICAKHILKIEYMRAHTHVHHRQCVCVYTPTYMHSYINHAHADAAYTEMKSALESAPGQGMNKEIYAFRYVDPLEEGKTR